MEFLLPFRFLPFEQKDAYEYGIIRSELQKRGNVIGNMDMLITSQALSNDLTLVTNNTKDFERIENLKLENWIE